MSEGRSAVIEPASSEIDPVAYTALVSSSSSPSTHTINTVTNRVVFVVQTSEEESLIFQLIL